MIVWVQRFVWSGTLAFGLQFLYVGYRVRFDRSYVWFGACLLLFSLIFLGDAWGVRDPSGGAGYARWDFLAYAGSLALLPALILFLSHATGIFSRLGLTLFLALDAVSAVALIWQRAGGTSFQSESAPVPCVISFLTCLGLGLYLQSRVLAIKIRAAKGGERQAFLILAGGLAAVALPRLANATALAFGQAALPAAVPLFGLGLFTVAGVYFQMRRFLLLHAANRDTVERLGSAYAELRESSHLRDLGISAASISHEIRNYVATLKGNAVLLNQGARSSLRQVEAERIRITAEKMEAVSQDIAAYSLASSPMALTPVRLDALARECVRLHFPDRADRFRIHDLPDHAGSAGEGRRLGEVFLNLFKNALEAGAMRVDVRFKVWGNRLVVAVEDDGSGCDPGDLDRLALPFFSSKGQAGTGLGCSIAQTILEAHGATMRPYSKNALGLGGSGLLLNLVFPLPAPPAGGPVGMEILVVSEAAETRDNIILPMIHLGLRPMLLTLEGFMREREPGRAAALFLDQAIAGRYFGSGGTLPAVLVDRFRKASFAQGKASLAAETTHAQPFLFSEENLAGILARGTAA